MTVSIRRRAMVLNLAVLAAGLIGGAGCTMRATLGDAGAGPQVEQDRAVEAFSALALRGGIEAEVNVGTPQRVTIAGRLQTLDATEVFVKDGVLHVEVPERGGHHGETLAVEITTPSLEAINTEGAAKLKVAGLRGESFALDVSGATRARLDGEVHALTAKLEGAGELDSTELLAQDVEIALTGAGRADVTALANLSAAIEGAGRVRYRGEPTVAKAVQGVGRVRPM